MLVRDKKDVGQRQKDVGKEKGSWEEMKDVGERQKDVHKTSNDIQ